MTPSFFHRIAIGFVFMSMFIAVSMSAASEEVDLSITEKTAVKGKSVGTGAQAATYYDITITLYNEGNVTSPQITLGIQDEVDGIWTNKTGTVAVKESTEFFFNDWPIVGPGDHTILIRYLPTNDSIQKTLFNSGSDTLNLGVEEVNDETEETPGFELVILLTALFTILVLKKRK